MDLGREGLSDRDSGYGSYGDENVVGCGAASRAWAASQDTTFYFGSETETLQSQDFTDTDRLRMLSAAGS